MLLYKIFCWYLTFFGVQNVIEAVITTPVACSLNLSHSSLSKQIEERIEDKGSLRLVRYHFNIKNDTGPFSTANTGGSFLINPYSSVLAIDGAAKSLLHLKEYFVEMSLYTLNFSVAEYQVELEQWPVNCLENVSATDLEIELKLLIFRNFGASRPSAITLEGEVCNQYMKVTDDNFGVHTYNCCRLDAEGQFICNDLEKSVWADTLFAAIIILQVVFVLFCPNLIPTLGRKGEKYVKYIHTTLNKPKLRVIRINTSDPDPDECFVKAYPFQPSALSSFKTKVLEQNENTIYTHNVKELRIFVKDIKVVAYGGSPVTLFGFLRSFFVRCDTMKDLQSEMRQGSDSNDSQTCSRKCEDLLDLESCCVTSACPPLCGECSCTKRSCLWYQILSFFMKLVYISITIPWWVRVWFYYKIEEGSLAKFKHILKENGLNQSYQGSLVLSLTPLHPFFIAMYVVWFLMLCSFFFLKAETRFDINSTLRKTLEHIRDEKRFDAFLKFIAFMLFPMKQLSILGLVLFPLWLIPTLTLGLILLSIMIFPMINFTFRLLLLILSICSCWKCLCCWNTEFCKTIRTIVTDWTEKSKSKYMRSKNSICYVTALILSLLLIVVSLIFIVESLGFYAECIVYLLIGIILNSDETLDYLVLVLSIAIYAHQCFNSVGSEYQAFGEDINKIIYEKLKGAVDKKAEEKKARQKKTCICGTAQQQQ